MNIGILIFVISVIVTGISAMRDKSHEQRKNQTPPHKNTQRPTQNTPRKKGIFEQIEEAFNEMASEFDEEEQNKKTSSPKPSSKKETVHSDKNLKKNVTPEHHRGESKRFETKQSHTGKVPSKDRYSTSRERSQSEKDIKKQLEDSLSKELFNVRSEIDKEKEKQLSLIEKKAKEIINDKYLSEKTKRYKLNQLLNSKSIEKNMTHQTFQFDNDPIVDGIIWQEILNKPKKL